MFYLCLKSLVILVLSQQIFNFFFEWDHSGFLDIFVKMGFSHVLSLFCFSFDLLLPPFSQQLLWLASFLFFFLFKDFIFK